MPRPALLRCAGKWTTGHPCPILFTPPEQLPYQHHQPPRSHCRCWKDSRHAPTSKHRCPRTPARTDAPAPDTNAGSCGPATHPVSQTDGPTHIGRPVCLGTSNSPCRCRQRSACESRSEPCVARHAPPSDFPTSIDGPTCLGSSTPRCVIRCRPACEPHSADLKIIQAPRSRQTGRGPTGHRSHRQHACSGS